MTCGAGRPAPFPLGGDGMTCEESAQFDSLKASCEELLELAEEYFGESSAPDRLRIKRAILRANAALGIEGPVE